jgi:2-iminobutanoate/2-iminopropanoate deaminase
MAEIARVTRAPVFHMPSISQAVVHGGTVYVSGVLGTLGTSVELVGGGIEAETRQAVANLVHVLDAAGSSLDNLLKVTVFLVRIEDFLPMEEIYGELITCRPARTTAYVTQLPLNAGIELDAIAAVSPTP